MNPSLFIQPFVFIIILGGVIWLMMELVRWLGVGTLIGG